MGPKKHFFLKELFERYRLDVQRFIAVKFGGNASEDITQEAFINLLNVENPDDIENPKAYLFQTASNLALNRIRREFLHKKYTDSVCSDEADIISQERRLQAQRDLAQVESALQKLPEKYRRTFVLSRVHGKTYPQISEELGIPISTVEKHIIKVLKFLRQNLEV